MPFSASSYDVGNAPQGASYAAPLVGMQLGQELASLPQAYMQGRENQRTIALQNAFPNGIPTDASGAPDVGAITSTLGKIGGGQYVQQLMPYLINASQGQRAMQGMGALSNYVEGGAPNMPAVAPRGANIGPAATSTGGPANVTPSQPQAKLQDQPTVMKIVAAQGIPNDQIGAVSDAISRQLGVGPTDPINPADPQIRNVLGPALQHFKTAGQVQPQQQAAPQAQPQQAVAQPPQVTPAGRRAPDDVPDVPGFDMETAKRLAFGEAQARQAAAGMASTNPAQAQALEKQADSYAARRQQILEYMSKQSQTEYEHSLKNTDVTNEAKNARDPAVAAFERTKAQTTNDVDRYGKQYDAISKVGSQADEELDNLKLAQRLVNDPNFSSGSLAKGSDMFKRISAAVGLDPNSATPDQLYDKLRAGEILNQIKGMAGTGPVRVAEMKFIDQMIAGRENTPSTLRSLLELQSRLYQRAQTIRDMAANYNGGHLDSGFDKQVAQFKNEHPLFSKDEMKDPRLISPPVLQSPQDIQRTGLKHGDPFKTADGRIKYVP